MAVLRLQDEKAPPGEPLPHVMRRPDPGTPRPDDEDLDVSSVQSVLAGSRLGYRRGHRAHLRRSSSITSTVIPRRACVYALSTWRRGTSRISASVGARHVC